MKIAVVFISLFMFMLSIMGLYGLYKKINTLAAKILFYAGSVVLLFVFIIIDLSCIFGIFAAG